MLTEAQIDELQQRCGIVDIATKLGAVLRKSGRKHIGSCPMCGGSRLAKRFEVKENNRWGCAVCPDGGDVIKLVEKVRGGTFLEAIEWLGGPRQLTPEETERLNRAKAAREKREKEEQAKYRERERGSAYGIWNGAMALTADERALPARDYLTARGLMWPDDMQLRYTPGLRFFHGEEEVDDGVKVRKVPRCIYRGPAIIAPFIRPDGRFGGVSMMFFDPARPGENATIADPDTGEGLPPKKSRGSTGGAHIVVVRPQGALRRLFIGEGLATVLSVYTALRKLARLRPGDGFWMSIDLGNLGGRATETVAHPTDKARNGHPVRVPGPEPDLDAPAIVIPDSVDELITLSDGDSEPYLTRMAHERARRRYQREGRKIRSPFADSGKDFNNMLREAVAA